MPRFKILVTGGSGFIGTNLVEKFLLDGHEILNVDLLEPQISSHRKYWRKTNINNYQDLSECIQFFSPEFIIHLAARTDLDGKTLADYKSNILGVENILKCAQKLPTLKKIIVTSSMLVCNVKHVPKNQRDFAPTTVYGNSKVRTEEIVWTSRPSCDWAIIRPTSIWGPWFKAPYKSFFDMVLAGKYFHIGDRGCTKTYGYIGNAVYQIEKILFSETLNDDNKVFYIGDYELTNIKVWANEIANELGTKIITVPYPIIVLLAIFGDILKFLGQKFPMNSFRLKNMTTDNEVNLKNTRMLAPELPYSRSEGIKQTLIWLKKD